MEVRIVKTCNGFQRLLFLDGALLPVDADLRETASIETVEVMPRAYFESLYKKLSEAMRGIPHAWNVLQQ